MRFRPAGAILASAIALASSSCSAPRVDDASAPADSLSRDETRRRAFATLVVGGDHSCVLARMGVRCWGANANTQSTAPASIRNARALSGGGTHTCAIDDDGVKCWG